MRGPGTTYETVLVDVDGRVALVTLNRPDQLNAFNRQMTAELLDALTTLDADEGVRAIVVTGAGRSFCAGAELGAGVIDTGDGAEAGAATGAGDTDDGAAPKDAGAATGAGTATEDDRRAGALGVRPWEMGTPIIAAINGAAVGMGLTYPLMWDIRIAAEDAKLGLVFTRRGLLPEGNSLWLLARLIGASKAAELLLTGRIFSGREAVDLGVVSRAVPKGEVVDTALELAADIAANTSPTAVALTKRMFYRYLEEDDRMAARAEELELFGWMARRPDAREGMTAFREKRPPDWPPRADLPT
jgi:enoyl-CoA hydratase/carnithine racemase